MPLPPPFTDPWTRRDFLARSAVGGFGLALGAAGCSRLHGVPGRTAAARPFATLGADPSARPHAELDLASLKPLLQELVAELETRVPYASALLLGNRNTSISVDDQTQDIAERFPTTGAVFTIFNGAWLEEAATADLTPEGLRATARALGTGARVRAGNIRIDPGVAATGHFRTACLTDPVALPLPDRFARVVELQRRARAIDGKLVNVSVDYREGIQTAVFVNRVKAVSQEVIRVRGGLFFLASDGQRTAGDWLGRGGTGGLELIGFDDDEIAALAVETHALLDAGPVAAGDYQVVVDGDITGTVAHESFGHGVELDMFVKDRAKAEQFIGKRVGSDRVNILDDPSLQNGFGSYFFDDEGQLAGPTVIVENGIFKRGLSDLMSATTLAVARSANGRRQDFRRKAYARMSNTFFASGGDGSREDLIAGVDHGFLLQKLSHGMEDPKGWGIMLATHIGREIKGGRLTGKLVSPVGITGYVPDVLASVDAVAGDFDARPGGCGKGDKEFVPVSTGGPHIRMRARLA